MARQSPTIVREFNCSGETAFVELESSDLIDETFEQQQDQKEQVTADYSYGFNDISESTKNDAPATQRHKKLIRSADLLRFLRTPR